MKQELRKRTILDLLDQQEFINIHTLVDLFQISPMTARRDLNQLERDGLLIRKYGGAIKSEQGERLFGFKNRVDQQKDQKEIICKCASAFINDGDTIFVDCGTTLYRLPKYLKDKQKIRVITNSLPIVSALIENPNVKINLLGGEVFSNRKAIYGEIASHEILSYHADKAFIGTNGISLQRGLSSYDINEAKITKHMAERSDEVYLLCDSSKIENDSYYIFAPLSMIDVLITDPGIGEYLQAYQKCDFKIIIAQ
jgi:DeoR family transcriptional regulator, fructose operon transcriptional repressor